MFYIFYLFKSMFKILYMCMCVFVCTYEYKDPPAPGARVTSNCEPPDSSAGNCTSIVCKSSILS